MASPRRAIPWFRLAALLAFALACLAGCAATNPPAQCKVDADCQEGVACVSGVCLACPPCGDNQLCVRGACHELYCDGRTCLDGQVCDGDVCVDTGCVGVKCGVNQGCAQGTCYPTQCGAQACPSGQLCVNSVCADPECLDISCPAGAVCVHGTCAATQCPSEQCPTGSVCADDGTCVQSSCYGVVCPGGTACANGQCLAQSCSSGTCPDGQLCVNGGCADPRCDGVSCPAGSKCAAGVCSPCAASETQCSDGQDDDCDGLIDCADPDCQGISCNDGNPCTLNETCQADHTCGAGQAKACNAPPSVCDSATGVCDPKDGSCSYAPLAKGAACDDNDSCTSGGTCDGKGNCSGTATTCPAPTDPCKTGAGTCNPKTGACTYANAPDGTTCSDGNACTVGDVCKAGVCKPGATKACNSPPAGGCYKAAGTCAPSTGVCSYSVEPSGTVCNDGNACTVGDRCDGKGKCTPGPVCPTSNPCQSGSCSGGACKYPDKSNYTVCGSSDGLRCCSGSCVDIRTNTKNCGGCGTTCASGRACESAESTTQCSVRPASGRCLCNVANSECPRGQICRDVSPYTNRCTPTSSSNCAPGEKYIDENSCPRVCSP